MVNSLYSYGYEGPENPVWSRLDNLGETQTCTQTWPADGRLEASEGWLVARRRVGACRRPGMAPGNKQVIQDRQEKTASRVIGYQNAEVFIQSLQGAKS